VRVAGVEDRPCIAVVGAGIGGLALAAALAASGTRCEVFEQEQWTAEDGGAGLEVAPDAVRPLRRLGPGARLACYPVAGGSQLSFTATVRSPSCPDDRDEPEDLVSSTTRAWFRGARAPVRGCRPVGLLHSVRTVVELKRV
jgi:2-polyprenyl-6-methoxyphenol hydroxylase-like FAD-dependent oxidoreductase